MVLKMRAIVQKMCAMVPKMCVMVPKCASWCQKCASWCQKSASLHYAKKDEHIFYLQGEPLMEKCFFLLILLVTKLAYFLLKVPQHGSTLR